MCEMYSTLRKKNDKFTLQDQLIFNQLGQNYHQAWKSCHVTRTRSLFTVCSEKAKTRINTLNKLKGNTKQKEKQKRRNNTEEKMDEENCPENQFECVEMKSKQ